MKQRIGVEFGLSKSEPRYRPEQQMMCMFMCIGFASPCRTGHGVGIAGYRRGALAKPSV